MALSCRGSGMVVTLKLESLQEAFARRDREFPRLGKLFLENELGSGNTQHNSSGRCKL